jgi:hypothetical protein
VNILNFQPSEMAFPTILKTRVVLKITCMSYYSLLVQSKRGNIFSKCFQFSEYLLLCFYQIFNEEHY